MTHHISLFGIERRTFLSDDLRVLPKPYALKHAPPGPMRVSGNCPRSAELGGIGGAGICVLKFRNLWGPVSPISLPDTGVLGLISSKCSFCFIFPSTH